MYKYLLLVALIPAVILQNADDINFDAWDIVEFRPCTGSRPAPTTVWIENCPQMPCELQRGTNFMFAMNYTSQTDAIALRPIITATALGVTAPYEPPENVATACNWLVGACCPTTAGEDLIWHFIMPILNFYPLVSFTTEVDLQDQNGISQGCFVYDVILVDN